MNEYKDIEAIYIMMFVATLIILYGIAQYVWK